jgi:hypothetical protein
MSSIWELEINKTPIDELNAAVADQYPVPIPEPDDSESAIMIIESQIVIFSILDAPPAEHSPVPIPEPSNELLLSTRDPEINKTPIEEVEPTS